MKRFLLLTLLSSFLTTTVFAEEMELIKIKLLDITVPAQMDDHGKFGMATPDFELRLQLKCTKRLRTWVDKKGSFTVPANRTKKPVKHKIAGVELTLTPDELESCREASSIWLTIEEEELIGTDEYLSLPLDYILFARESDLKRNSTVIYTMDGGDGEADWTIMGFGHYKNFKATVQFRSTVLKE